MSLPTQILLAYGYILLFVWVLVEQLGVPLPATPLLVAAGALSFDAAPSVHGDGEIWLDARVRINRADFGLTWNLLGLVSVTNTLTVHTVFTKR